MAAGIFPEQDENAIYLSRSDANEVLSAFSKHGFQLEDKQWPSVEHYFQAMKFEDTDYQEKIRQSTTPKQARKLGRTRFKKIRKDWSKVKTTIMTRAVYTKCHAHPDVKKALLDTDNNKLVENSQYDYYWGCGRDRRGENHYGKVLMRVRHKLLEEQSADSV